MQNAEFGDPRGVPVAREAASLRIALKRIPALVRSKILLTQPVQANLFDCFGCGLLRGDCDKVFGVSFSRGKHLVAECEKRERRKMGVKTFVRKNYTLFGYHCLPIAWAWIRRVLLLERHFTAAYEGENFHQDGVYAVFVLWQRDETPWYVLNALKALNDAAVNVLLVVNHDLPEARIRELQPKVWRILIRDNSGFDMGAYRCGTLELRTRNPQRVIYLNDSVYYFSEGLVDFFKRLATSSSDVCGAFENDEITRHIQSFCFSVSRQVFENPKFIKFWNFYLPVNSRQWSIHRGEFQLGRVLSQIADFDIIYTLDALLLAIAASSEEPADIYGYLPLFIRSRDADLKSRFMEDMTRELNCTLRGKNLIHRAGFLFRSFLRSPLLKRDIVWRGLHDIDEARRFVQLTGDEGQLTAIMNDLYRRGRPDQLDKWEDMKFNLGVI